MRLSALDERGSFVPHPGLARVNSKTRAPFVIEGWHFHIEPVIRLYNLGLPSARKNEFISPIKPLTCGAGHKLEVFYKLKCLMNDDVDGITFACPLFPHKAR